MAEQILVSKSGSGCSCEHAVVDPETKGEVVLCEPCLELLDAGAKVIDKETGKEFSFSGRTGMLRLWEVPKK